ncbi:TetR family transcriptional regulator [Limosilactobacillus reuteri]|uniref:TetR family transcriptional regulator n=1 Tax=Limosilactobacillus reuteri TaxID=1598 RepID=A0A2S1ENF2_LIMRT|nr:TetR family transcriptional regulator [Limosilactobacillus reuteri]
MRAKFPFLHNILDTLPESLSINEIKSIAGLIQTKSPVELIQIYKSYLN